MAEGMACKPVFPTETVFMGMDVAGKKKCIDGFIFSVLFWKKEASGFTSFKPVFRQKVQSMFGKNGITVTSVF